MVEEEDGDSRPLDRAEMRRRILAESARVEAFSDGVFAIALTILVLGLHAPEGRGTLLHELLLQWPAYVAYLSSFAYVGVTWVNHHQLFTRIDRVDTGLLWRNLILLLTTSIIPFPTAVVGNAFQFGQKSDELVAIVAYALVCAASAGSWLLVFGYLGKNVRLLAEGTPGKFFAVERRRAAAGIGASVMVIGGALWEPVSGLVIAAILPIFYGVTSEGLFSTSFRGPAQPSRRTPRAGS